MARRMSARRRSDRVAAQVDSWASGACVAHATLTQHLRDQEGQLQACWCSAAGRRRSRSGGQIRLVDLLGAAEALGDVVAGQLDVQAARPGSQRRGTPRRSPAPRRSRRRSAGSCSRSAVSNGVAVHGIADPDDLTRRSRDLLDQGRQRVADLARRPSGVIKVSRPGVAVRVELVDQRGASSGRGRWRRASRRWGCRTRAAKSTCAPSSSRVRSPIQTMCADRS